jgi:hypothetical protein
VHWNLFQCVVCVCWYHLLYILLIVFVFYLFSDDFNSWYYVTLNDVMMSEYYSGSDMNGAVLPILRQG